MMGTMRFSLVVQENILMGAPLDISIMEYGEAP